MAGKLNFLNRSPFFIRLFHWEYWPFHLLQVPVSLYYTWLSIRTRSFFFFSASNPSIETGGMFGESKWKIFEIMPKHLFPTTILVPEGSRLEEIKKQMNERDIHYPVIAKPDRGERGWLVSKIENEDQLEKYFFEVKVDFMIQNYVSLPVELSLFYYRFPNEEKGTISSLVIKEMLGVTGNGKSTLIELIKDYPRALLQLPVLKKSSGGRLNEIPKDGDQVELVPIGNHSRGAMFLDACHLVDEKLTSTFDVISKSIPGFYFGRYDLRCNSIEELKDGRNFLVMELNGAGAEPAHIYQPGFSLITAYRVLIHHFNILAKISEYNHQSGVPYMNLREYLAMRKFEKEYKHKGNGH